MKLQIELFDSFCSVGRFIINEVDADKDDFGGQGDQSPDEADDYGCGNMTFTPHDYPSEGVLVKYGIILDEFDFIAAGLAKKLSFGCCGLCA